MSSFSDVDRSPNVAVLAAYLEGADRGLAAMKTYTAAAAARALGTGLVLDLGCGLGGDLTRLAAAGLDPIGVDTSAEMLRRAQPRLSESVPLLQADGARLPFRDASLDGCRIERVLEHVDEPAVVVAEVGRVLRPGGFVAIFEPDFGTFRVESAEVPDASVPASLMRVRQPRIGNELVALLETHGCRVHDVVTESSRGYALDRLPISVNGVIERAVLDGRLGEERAQRWLAEQRAKTSDGTFRASWDKVLVIASKR